MIIFLQFEIPSKSFLELLLTTHLKFVEALLSLEYTPLEPCFGILYQTLTHMRRGRPLSSVFYPPPPIWAISICPSPGRWKKSFAYQLNPLSFLCLVGHTKNQILKRWLMTQFYFIFYIHFKKF